MVILGQKSINTTRRLSRVSSCLWVVTQQLACLCKTLAARYYLTTCTTNTPYKNSKIACWYATGCTARIYEVPSVSVLRQELDLKMLEYNFISFPYDAKWSLGDSESPLTSLCLVNLIQFFYGTWILVNFSVPNWLILVTWTFLQWLYIYIQIANIK